MTHITLRASTNSSELDRIADALKAKITDDPKMYDEFLRLFPTPDDLFFIEPGSKPDGAPMINIFPTQKLLEFVGLSEG